MARTRSGECPIGGRQADVGITMPLTIPALLASTCATSPNRTAWLERLQETLAHLEREWAITVGAPIDTNEVSCAWVAPVVRADGSSAVLKVGMPHMEAEHEIDGLRFWD